MCRRWPLSWPSAADAGAGQVNAAADPGYAREKAERSPARKIELAA